MLQTCGFEILSSQQHKEDSVDYRSDASWQHFVTSLQDKGYFQVNEHVMEPLSIYCSLGGAGGLQTTQGTDREG